MSLTEVAGVAPSPNPQLIRVCPHPGCRKKMNTEGRQERKDGIGDRSNLRRRSAWPIRGFPHLGQILTPQPRGLSPQPTGSVPNRDKRLGKTVKDRPDFGALKTSRRDSAIVAWHEVPGTSPHKKAVP